ncbi:MAG: SDR family oxidoreductase [Alphaproteobacteria bacterium]|nr:SDR family oxidoreductase [Alphaproteobacteria bacterium]
MTDLTNKTVLITGASRGIGEAAAREFAAQGANVALAARSGGDIERIASEIGAKAMAVKCDVSDRASLNAAVAATVAKFGGLDILINNAGSIDPIGPLAEIDPDAWDKVIDVNVKGVFYGIKAALPHMSGGGTILTIGSGAATSALEGWSHYCASKAAVHHLNACVHKELGDQGIRAIILSPGTVATQMQRDIRASGINPVAQMDWEDHIPAEWPAKTLAWMCGAEANEYLGQVVALRDDNIRRKVGLIA